MGTAVQRENCRRLWWLDATPRSSHFLVIKRACVLQHCIALQDACHLVSQQLQGMPFHIGGVVSAPTLYPVAIAHH